MKMLENKKGFTLVELLITLVIAGLILTIVSGLFFNIFRSKTTIEEQQALPSTALTFYNQIEKKVKWADAVTGTGSSLVFEDEEGVHTIGISNGQLVMDGVALTPEGIRVTDFGVSNYSSDPDLPSLKFTLDLQSEEITTHHYETSFVLSLRKKDVALK